MSQLSPSLDIRIPTKLTTTLDIDQWIEEVGMASSHSDAVSSQISPQINPQAMVHISALPTVLGYMTDPVDIYEGHALTAATRKFKDFSELSQFVLGATAGIFIYKILYSAAYPYFNEADENGVLYPVESIKYIPETWVLRYAIINEFSIND